MKKRGGLLGRGSVRSFYAVVTAHPGYVLRGGVKSARSSRFDTKQDAEDWAEAMISGQSPTPSVRIEASKRAPEVL